MIPNMPAEDGYRQDSIVLIVGIPVWQHLITLTTICLVCVV